MWLDKLAQVRPVDAWGISRVSGTTARQDRSASAGEGQNSDVTVAVAFDAPNRGHAIAQRMQRGHYSVLVGPSVPTGLCSASTANLRADMAMHTSMDADEKSEKSLSMAVASSNCLALMIFATTPVTK